MEECNHSGYLGRSGISYCGGCGRDLKGIRNELIMRNMAGNDEVRLLRGESYLLGTIVTLAASVVLMGSALLIEGGRTEQNKAENVEVRVKPADSSVSSRVLRVERDILVMNLMKLGVDSGRYREILE